jgi:hypothetical protein
MYSLAYLRILLQILQQLCHIVLALTLATLVFAERLLVEHLLKVMTLQVCRTSHRSRAFKQLRTTYGQSRVGKDGTTSGWLTDNGALLQRLVNQYSIDWRTADMQVCFADLAGTLLLYS